MQFQQVQLRLRDRDRLDAAYRVAMDTNRVVQDMREPETDATNMP